jgi:adenosine deaminase
VRYAPELSTEGGLTLDEVVTAILEGFREGEHRAGRQGRRIVATAMKSAFAPFDERLEIIDEAVKPGYARLRAREARVLGDAPARVA